MLRILTGLIILTGILSAQYTADDIELVKTVYTKQSDKDIILSYLTSGDEIKVRAALLSISQSRDTSFIPHIIKLKFPAVSDYIAFTLGQLGESRLSTNYLLKKLEEVRHGVIPQGQNIFVKHIYEALGRTGTSATLNDLLAGYEEGEYGSGISFAIVNFASRNITDSLQREFDILSREFLNKKNDLQIRIDALFAASRLNLQAKAVPVLAQVLREKPEGEAGVYFLQYALVALRKTGQVPEDIDVIRELLKHKDWRIRTEAVKVFCLSSFDKREDPDLYFRLLKDVNPNVSRQTAISIRSIKLSDSNRLHADELFRDYLNSKDSLTSNTSGELFISFTKLFPEKLHSSIDEYGKMADMNFIYNALEQNTAEPEKNFEYLVKHPPHTNTEKINYFSAMLALKGMEDEKYDKMLLSNLNSSFSPVAAIIAEGMDSSFVIKHSAALRGIILSNINTKLHDPDFAEALISLAALANRVDTLFYEEVLEVLRNSSLYSVQKYSYEQLKLTLPEKPETNFDNAWNNAFRYRKAKIITSKGEFTIELYPEYAPVSAGNFCYLALTGYFNSNNFHRVVPNFVIQTGDRQGTGWGGPGYEIISEFSSLSYETGYVGMASSGKDTEGSQWFVMHSYFPHLNGRYTNFGKVIEGMDVVNAIDQGDKVVKVVLVE